MKTRKSNKGSIIRNKWTGESSDTSNDKSNDRNKLTDFKIATKLSKVSKTSQKNSYRSSLIRKNHMALIKEQSFQSKVELKQKASKNIKENKVLCLNKQDNDSSKNLHALLTLREAQLKRAHELTNECLQKIEDAEKKKKKYLSLEMEVIKLKRELAECRSQNMSLKLSKPLSTSKTFSVNKKNYYCNCAKPQSSKQFKKYQVCSQVKNEEFLLKANNSIKRLRQTCLEQDLIKQQESPKKH